MKALFLSLTRRTAFLVLFETVLILAAVCAGVWIRGGSDELSEMFAQEGMPKALLITVICQLCLYYSDMYDLRVLSDRRELFIRIVQSLGATSFLLAATYYWFPALMIGRGVFVLSAFFVVTLVAGWRIAFEWLANRAPRKRLLLVGTGPAAIALARELFDRRHDLGLEIIGFVDPNPAKVGMPLINPGIIGTIDDIPLIVHERSVDRVVVSLGDARGMLPMDKLLEMKLNGVTFDHLASVYEELTGKIAVENLRPSWLIFSPGFRKGRFLQTMKRAIDILAGAFGLVLLAPIMGLTALVVKYTSPGGAVYRQERVGLHGKVFTLCKFRSMRSDAEAKSGAVWAQTNDPRITGIGRFMRKTRLDELPQLWNVLRGDMSLVGPRPERPEFVTSLTQQIPFYGQRHVVRPGLTGWAQVRYAYGASVEDSMEKLQYDLYYIKNLSIALDLFVIFSTIKTVILRRGN
jgi:sugar transferase (PEP-CTERM system associated)